MEIWYSQVALHVELDINCLWQTCFTNNSAYCDSLRYKLIHHTLTHALEVKEDKKVAQEKKVIPEIKKEGRLLETPSGDQGAGSHVPLKSFHNTTYG